MALGSTAQCMGRVYVAGVGRIRCRPAGTGGGRFALATIVTKAASSSRQFVLPCPRGASSATQTAAGQPRRPGADPQDDRRPSETTRRATRTTKDGRRGSDKDLCTTPPSMTENGRGVSSVGLARREHRRSRELAYSRGFEGALELAHRAPSHFTTCGSWLHARCLPNLVGRPARAVDDSLWLSWSQKRHLR